MHEKAAHCLVLSGVVRQIKVSLGRLKCYQPQDRQGKSATVKDSKTDVSNVSPSSE